MYNYNTLNRFLVGPSISSFKKFAHSIFQHPKEKTQKPKEIVLFLKNLRRYTDMSRMLKILPEV